MLSVSRALSKVFPAKPSNWCPSPVLYLITLTATYATLFLLPFSANTASFSTLTTLSRALSFAPLALPHLVPQSWGTVHAHPHAAYGVYTRLFRFMAAASTLLYANSSVAAFLFNLPGAWKHRHSLRVPFDVQHRTNWERTQTAVGKVLGSMSDHPAVGAAAMDVVLCAVGMGIWAAVRGVGVDDILGSAVPFYKPDATKEGLMRAVVKEEEKIEDGAEDVLQSAVVRRSGRSVRGRIASGDAGGSKEAEDDKAATATGTRRRGRPRKVNAEPELATETEELAATGDATYVPEPSVAAEVAEGDRLEVEDDWEAAAVAWGITALGGLGAGCAGVFGGECIAR